MKMQHVAMFVGMIAVATDAPGQDKDTKRSDEAKKAIAAIKKLGGLVVHLDDKKPGKPVIYVNLGVTKVSNATTAAAGVAPMPSCSIPELDRNTPNARASPGCTRPVGIGRRRVRSIAWSMSRSATWFSAAAPPATNAEPMTV